MSPRGQFWPTAATSGTLVDCHSWGGDCWQLVGENQGFNSKESPVQTSPRSHEGPVHPKLASRVPPTFIRSPSFHVGHPLPNQVHAETVLTVQTLDHLSVSACKMG